MDNWQYYQFIVECFCLPEAVGKVNIKDEQFCKLLAAAKESMGSGPIQMLDYGAGKCRIWECMQLLPDSELGKNNVVYTAYEPYPGAGGEGYKANIREYKVRRTHPDDNKRQIKIRVDGIKDSSNKDG